MQDWITSEYLSILNGRYRRDLRPRRAAGLSRCGSLLATSIYFVACPCVMNERHTPFFNLLLVNCLSELCESYDLSRLIYGSYTSLLIHKQALYYYYFIALLDEIENWKKNSPLFDFKSLQKKKEAAKRHWSFERYFSFQVSFHSREAPRGQSGPFFSDHFWLSNFWLKYAVYAVYGLF